MKRHPFADYLLDLLLLVLDELSLSLGAVHVKLIGSVDDLPQFTFIFLGLELLFFKNRPEALNFIDEVIVEVEFALDPAELQHVVDFVHVGNAPEPQVLLDEAFLDLDLAIELADLCPAEQALVLFLRAKRLNGPLCCHSFLGRSPLR